MFTFVHSKLRNFFDLIVSVYIRLILNRPCYMIFFYLLLSILFSFGLLQIKFNMDTDSLSIVRNSESINSAKLIENEFKFDSHNRHFINKLLDLGHYVEIIVLANASSNAQQKRLSNDDLLKPEYNIINQTILNEFNDLFDSIMNLSIEDYDIPLNDSLTVNVNFTYNLKNYSYSKDLCARRLKKCSIEGGLIRKVKVQKDLLNHQVNYQIKDPKSSYGDVEEVDGFSVNVLFGKYRLENRTGELINEEYGEKHIITHASALRTRFDILSTNKREKHLALKFMHKFGLVMEEAQKSGRYKHLNFSYYTSHTLGSELERYSKWDVDLVQIMFSTFWLTFCISLWFGANSSSFSSGKLKWFKNFFSYETLCIFNSSYLPLMILIKFILTITSSFGFVSLINIEINPFTFAIIIVMMIIGCHQSFTIYFNIVDWLISKQNSNQLSKLNYEAIDDDELVEDIVNETKSNNLKTSQLIQKSNDENNNNNNCDKNLTKINQVKNIKNEFIDVRECLKVTAQTQLVPIFFNLLSTIMTYTFIGITISFDSLRVYCILIIVAMILNFNSILMFLFPCLVLNLNRIRINRNCFTFCSKNNHHMLNKKIKKCSTQEPNENDDIGDKFVIVNEQLDDNTQKQENKEESNIKDKDLKVKKNHMKQIWFTKIKQVYSAKQNVFDLFFDTKLKFLILCVFVVYFCFNLSILIIKYKADLPVTDLIPQESYLRKHMVNHQQLFNVGPIIIINFMKPIKYWNETQFKMIRSFLNDIKNLPTVEKLFEINWLQDTYQESAKYSKNPLDFSSFHNSFEFIAPNDILKDDVNYNNGTDEQTFEIKSSRMYLSFQNFFGNQQEMNVMNDIKDLAVDRYNFTLNDELIVFSPVYVFFEQMEELTPSFLTFILLNIESCIIISFILIFDLKKILILSFTLLSTLISIASNIFLFGFTLNMVVLVHFIMIPALICEFFYSPIYSYLYSFKFEQTNEKSQINIPESKRGKLEGSLSSSKCNENTTPTVSFEESSLDDNSISFKFFKKLFNKKVKPNKTHSYKNLKYSYEKTIRHSMKFLLLLFLNLFIILCCKTYSFRALCIILISCTFNILINLYLFLPALLSIFGGNI